MGLLQRRRSCLGLSAFRAFTLSLSLPKKYKQPRRGRRRIFASIRSLHLSSGSPNPHHKPQFTQTATNPEEGELFASMARLFKRVGSPSTPIWASVYPKPC